MASTKQRIFLYVAAACFLLVATLAVSLPWVYARAVPYFLGKEGFAIGSVSHNVFSTLRLKDIRYEAPAQGVLLDIAELRLPAFYPLLRGAFAGDDKRASIFLQDWQLTLHLPSAAANGGSASNAAVSNATEPPANGSAQTQGAAALGKTTALGKAAMQDGNGASPALSPAEQVLLLRKWLMVADPWLQEVRLEKGRVLMADQRLELPLIRWAGGNISVNGTLANADKEADESFTLAVQRLSLPATGLLVEATLPERKLSGELRADIPFASPSTLNAALSLRWEEGHAEASANWDATGWVPQAAAIDTRDFPVPPEVIRLPNYEQPQLTLMARWQDKAGTIHLDGHAAGLSEDAPPFQWNLNALADTGGITIETLQMTGPWVKGELSEPLRLQWQQFFIQDNSVRAAVLGQPQPPLPHEVPTLLLTIDVNLADFPFIPLEGHATGTLHLWADASGRAQADVELSSETLSWRSIKLSTLKLQGQLRGNIVEIREMDLRADDGSYLTAVGALNLATHSIDRAEIKGSVTDPFVQALGAALPQGENAEFVVQLFGPFTELSHAGQVRVNRIALASEKAHIDAILQWEGKMLDIPAIQLSTVGEALEANVKAAFNRDGDLGEDTLTLKSAELRAGKYPPVRLEAPSTLTYSESAGTFTLTPLKLTSDGEGYLLAHVSLPQQGNPGQLSLQAAHVSGRWLEIYRNANLPCPIAIDALTVHFSWDDDQYLQGIIDLAAHAEPQYLPPVPLSLKATLDETGLQLTELTAKGADNTLLEASASLPLSFYMNKADGLEQRLSMTEPLNLQIQANLNDPTLATWLMDTFQLHLQGLRAGVKIDGTLEKPVGNILLAIDSLAWERPPEGMPALPRIESLRVEAAVDAEQFQLTSFNALLGNAPLIASATLPISTQERRALLLSGTAPSFSKASAHLTSGQIPLQALEPVLPPLLRNSGSIALEAALQPELSFSGSITVQGVGTRPLPPIGSFENIDARLQLRDKQVTIEQLQAQIGAQPVSISGTVDLSQPEQPRYDIKLEGGELPVVRSPGLILRARPDVTLRTDEQGISTLSGSLELTRSFYTIDFAALTAPGGADGSSGAANRPPYFSVTEQPMAGWRLNLRLYGDQFLRVRTPVFEGIVSANFNLRGPLAAPYTFGTARLDTGVVLFPFATLRMNSGTLTLQQDDPYSPRLNLNAEGRAYGYDLRMAITGTASEPNIQFASTPSLEQGEILMLLSTGQIPNAPERSAMSRLSGLGMFLGNNVLINLGLSDPLDERFELLIGEDVTERDQDTITVRYRLTDDWSVIGSYDRFDAYNLDLQWTIYRD